MKYIFPPRPENKVPRSSIDTFDDGTFMAQPKFNGSCAELYLDKSFKVMNRHQQTLSGVTIKEDEFRSIFDFGKENLIVGEYMNKSKKGLDGKIFNHKFMTFDIIVSDGTHLLGKTFSERYDMLYEKFKILDEDELTYKLSDNIYLVKNYEKDFGKIWDNITKIDMIEGLVLKKKNAGLELGTREKNNWANQIKIRKTEKNYSY